MNSQLCGFSVLVDLLSDPMGVNQNQNQNQKKE
jgi:hypothetical protein